MRPDWALLFNMIQGATPKIMPVPLASMTVPEDHWRRAATLKRTFRVIAAIIKGDRNPADFARYMPAKGRSAEKDNTFSYLVARDAKAVSSDFANLSNMLPVKECALNPTAAPCIRMNLEKWFPFRSAPPA